MNSFSHVVPPGFRFHPTDEELVDYYLRKKVASKRIDLNVIKDIDLYNIEPWDLQELCRIGTEEENDWYFFSHKDKKYPTGTRTNRATKAGFWKATGRDKAIYSKHNLIGMRKTLEEGWVVCKVFKKKMAATTRREGEHESLYPYDMEQQVSNNFMRPNNHLDSSYHYRREMELQYNNIPISDALFLQQLPNLESPRVQHSTATMHVPFGISLQERNEIEDAYNNNAMMNEQGVLLDDEVTDWRVLDKFVASQLSQDIDQLISNSNNEDNH
ncbi:hypothetical protein RD792_009076 [Penstemon davidsonii]|uniref:NAC domain-containing protein n=1 Tax=Penstemon davidsonii TaxID=160366 RepID=A0ABR0DB13_9LAMI|nr:hypothetical protein RD792_009076 [Penstemon davidsonii]